MDKLTYLIELSDGAYNVILMNGSNTRVTAFGMYETKQDAIDGANGDSNERQGCDAPLTFAKFHYEAIPYDVADLVNVTWFPYGDDPAFASVNSGGYNGYIIGTVVKGSTFSRLFHATSNKPWATGVEKRIDYIVSARCRFDEDGNGTYVSATCG